jgi:hypothetical protein
VLETNLSASILVSAPPRLPDTVAGGVPDFVFSLEDVDNTINKETTTKLETARLEKIAFLCFTK